MKKAISILMLGIILTSCHTAKYHYQKFIDKGGKVAPTEIRITDTIPVNGKDSIIERLVKVDCPDLDIKSNVQIRQEEKTKRNESDNERKKSNTKERQDTKKEKSEDKKETKIKKSEDNKSVKLARIEKNKIRLLERINAKLKKDLNNRIKPWKVWLYCIICLIIGVLLSKQIKWLMRKINVPLSVISSVYKNVN